jgi:hypothetical protein
MRRYRRGGILAAVCLGEMPTYQREENKESKTTSYRDPFRLLLQFGQIAIDQTMTRWPTSRRFATHSTS